MLNKYLLNEQMNEGVNDLGGIKEGFTEEVVFPCILNNKWLLTRGRLGEGVTLLRDSQEVG